MLLRQNSVSNGIHVRKLICTWTPNIPIVERRIMFQTIVFSGVWQSTVYPTGPIRTIFHDVIQLCQFCLGSWWCQPQLVRGISSMNQQISALSSQKFVYAHKGWPFEIYSHRIHVWICMVYLPPMTGCYLLWLDVTSPDWMLPPMTGCYLLWLNDVQQSISYIFGGGKCWNRIHHDQLIVSLVSANPIYHRETGGGPLGWRAPSCLTPLNKPFERGDIPYKYPRYKVYMALIITGTIPYLTWGWLLRGPHPKGPPPFSQWI